MMKRRAFVLSSLALVAASNANARSLFKGTAAHVPDWQARHFTPGEFASKGDGRVRITANLLGSLDTVRHRLSKPTRILSGYRDPAHNARVGGARLSRHLISDAVDIDLRRYGAKDRYRLAWLLLEGGFTSFGTYGHIPFLLHADQRPKAAIWRYGGGDHPDWLRRALRAWNWQPVSGASGF